MSSGLRGRLRLALAWGVVDQGLASAVGFVLTVATGRRLGASGLGSVALALIVYLVFLGLQRAVVLDPLAVQNDGGGTRSALLASCAAGLTGTAALYALSVALDGETAAAMRAFAPWVTPALVIDAVRVAGFRDGKPGAGPAAGAAWLVVMLAALAATSGGFGVTDAALSWGVGAAAGAIVGLATLRAMPGAPGAAWAWWKTAWVLARWLAPQTVVHTAGMQGAQLALGVLGGPAALGTLRAVQTLFAPLTLLLPAVTTPALPVVARTLRASPPAARSLTARLSLALSAACATYLLVAFVARDALGALAFGSSFDVPFDVMVPIALGQLVLAGGVGTFLLLRAAGDGRSVFVATAVSSATALLSVLVFGRAFGASGAAWGIAVGAAAATAVAVAFVGSAVKDKGSAPVRVRMAPTP